MPAGALAAAISTLTLLFPGQAKLPFVRLDAAGY
jgi:hypothetical protein